MGISNVKAAGEDGSTIYSTFTVTLPTAVGIVGKVYNVKNTGTGTITVAAAGSQVIDSDATKSLAQWASLTVQSTNTNWIML